MPRDVGKRRERPEEDIALLNKIEVANPSAAVDFLEYLVLQRRNSVSHLFQTIFPISVFALQEKEICTRLAQTWTQKILSYLKDDNVSKLWRAKGALQSFPNTLL